MLFMTGRRIALMFFFFFFNDTATTEIYTLSLHDALPICASPLFSVQYSTPSDFSLTSAFSFRRRRLKLRVPNASSEARSEEHTSELQSRLHLVCRLLLEKKKQSTADPIS